MSMTIDDADLIRSFKSGHHEVLEAIVAEHQAELIRHARRRRCDGDKTERLSCDTTTALVEPSNEQQLGLHIDDTGLEQALAGLPDLP